MRLMTLAAKRALYTFRLLLLLLFSCMSDRPPRRRRVFCTAWRIPIYKYIYSRRMICARRLHARRWALPRPVLFGTQLAVKLRSPKSATEFNTTQCTGSARKSNIVFFFFLSSSSLSTSFSSFSSSFSGGILFYIYLIIHSESVVNYTLWSIRRCATV